jgi:hypothetical protein
MKIWHRLRAAAIGRRIRKERRELAKYMRRSAYEMIAWRQDITFLEEERDHHLAKAGLALSEPKPALEEPVADNVVPMGELVPHHSASSSK